MSNRVRRANKLVKATATQLLAAVSGVFVGHSIQLYTSFELSDVDQVNIWDIFEQNMRHLYTNSSMGWDPPSKKQELFHRDSRFVLLRRSQAQDSLEHLHEELPILAYSMFRFDMEGDECVLYCYELQVSQSVQRGGMGKTLMGCLCDIARHWNMQKVMLTVFKENQAAFSFYKAIGFNVVESDEEWVDEEEDMDYWIMMKSLIPYQ